MWCYCLILFVAQTHVMQSTKKVSNNKKVNILFKRKSEYFLVVKYLWKMLKWFSTPVVTLPGRFCEFERTWLHASTKNHIHTSWLKVATKLAKKFAILVNDVAVHHLLLASTYSCFISKLIHESRMPSCIFSQSRCSLI